MNFICPNLCDINAQFCDNAPELDLTFTQHKENGICLHKSLMEELLRLQLPIK